MREQQEVECQQRDEKREEEQLIRDVEEKRLSLEQLKIEVECKARANLETQRVEWELENETKS